MPHAPSTAIVPKPPVCDSAFDVAFWLIDRALEDGEYLQPQKMQRLMYLAQAYWGVVSRGQRLIPGVFVISALGPIEPNSWRAMESGRPTLGTKPLSEQHRHFLNSVWRRFGAHSADHLLKLVSSHPPYVDAVAIGPRAEIPLESMMAYYGRREEETDDRLAAPALKAVLRPQVMRSQDGKPVNVQRWMPTRRVSTSTQDSDPT